MLSYHPLHPCPTDIPHPHTPLCTLSAPPPPPRTPPCPPCTVATRYRRPAVPVLSPHPFLTLHPPSPRPPGIAALQSLPRLQRLSLQSCVRLTNRCLSAVAALVGLQDLNLRGCLQFNDEEGLQQLSHLTDLRALNLKGCLALKGRRAGAK